MISVNDDNAAALEVCLANGRHERFGGEICEVAMLGSDGGLARYRVRLSPWIWRLGQGQLRTANLALRNNGCRKNKKGAMIAHDAFDAAAKFVVGRAGFEPATNGLKVRCSTS